MKKEKILRFVSVLVIVGIVGFLAIRTNVATTVDKTKKEEYENIAYDFVTALEKYIDYSKTSSNTTTIHNGVYTINQLKELGFRINSKLPKNSVINIDVFGNVDQLWFEFDDNYKVYYSVADYKALATNTGSYVDNSGREHNELPEAVGSYIY